MGQGWRRTGRWGQQRAPWLTSDPALITVFVQHIEAVREGHQSEGLRRFGGAFAPARCLTIAFKGRRKNLDLAAPTAEEAQRWVRGLAKLRARLDAMSQRERLDQYPAGLGGRTCPWRAPGLSSWCSEMQWKFILTWPEPLSRRGTIPTPGRKQGG